MLIRIENKQGIQHGGKLYPIGSELEIDDQLGAEYCKNGHARDLAGKVHTMGPKSGDTRLEVNNLKIDPVPGEI